MYPPITQRDLLTSKRRFCKKHVFGSEFLEEVPIFSKILGSENPVRIVQRFSRTYVRKSLLSGGSATCSFMSYYIPEVCGALQVARSMSQDLLSESAFDLNLASPMSLQDSQRSIAFTCTAKEQRCVSVAALLSHI